MWGLIFLCVPLLEQVAAHEIFVINDVGTNGLRHRRDVTRMTSEDHPSISIFPADYDQFSLPPTTDEAPLPVVFSVKVRDLLSIDEKVMDLTVEWYVRMYWRDSRLRAPLDAFPNTSQWVNIDPAVTPKMWLPTTYIDHVKDILVPALLIRPHSLRMTSQGLLRYSMAVITKLACPMDFSAYPFDKQKCHMKLESYQYRAFEVIYSWHENGIQTNADIKTDHYIPTFRISETSNIVHDNASFSFVQVDILLERKATYHLMNTYIPSALFVAVSWLTFLIPPEHLPGRMVLTITTLLTIVSMFNTVRQESPKVSYAKAIDQWMMFCIVLVFVVLVEYTYVVHLHFTAERLRQVVVEPKREGNGSANRSGASGKASNSTRSDLYRQWKVRLERMCPRVLIVIFIIFNVIYWSYWLSYK